MEEGEKWRTIHFFNNNLKNNPMEEKKTSKEIAQWVIDNRYPKNEYDKISDFEMYRELIIMIDKSNLEAAEREVEEKDSDKQKMAELIHYKDSKIDSLEFELSKAKREIEELKEIIKSAQIITGPDAESFLEKISNPIQVNDQEKERIRKSVEWLNKISKFDI